MAQFVLWILVAARRPISARGRTDRPKRLCLQSYLEARPEVVAEAKRLHRASPKTGERRSLRKIAAALATLGSTSMADPTAASR
jgi:hypothetical protein